MKAEIALATILITGAMTVLPALAQSGRGSAGGTSSSETTSSGSATSPGTDMKSGTTATDSKTDMKSDMKTDSKTDMKSDMKSGRTAGTLSEGRNGAAGASREQVEALQRALKDKGHDPGEIDGIMGPKTRKALREFQQKEGLKASGQIDAETRDRLGLQASAGGSQNVATGATSPSSPATSPSSPVPAAATDSDNQGSAGTGTDSKR